MNNNDQEARDGPEPASRAPSTDLAARSSRAKPRTREVKARYLQTKQAPAGRRTSLHPAASGRPSLAAYTSTGWVELQLPNHASTPLMMHTGHSSSAAFTHNSRGQHNQVQQTPAVGQPDRWLSLQQPHQPHHQQQRPQLQSAFSGNPYATQQQQQQSTPAAAPAGARLAAAYVQQQRQHDVAPMSDTLHWDTPSAGNQQHHLASSALVSPGSSRSSTSCSVRYCNDGPSTQAALQHTRSQQCMQHRSQFAAMHTPQIPRLAASFAVPASQMRPGRMGMSADVAGVLQGPCRTADKGAEQRRAQLEAFRLQKRLQQQAAAQTRPTSAGAGGFKEPKPKLTLFKATAAAVTNESKTGTSTSACTHKEPNGPAAVPSTPATTVAGLPAPAGSAASRAPSLGQPASPAPGSAFTATMASLQQSGSGNKPSRPLSAGRFMSASRSGGKQQERPSPASAQQLLRSDISSGSTPSSNQQQPRGGHSPLLLSATKTKIPILNLAALQQQQQQQQQQSQPSDSTMPFTSRHVSTAARVPLPDGTPRAFRHAPPSRLPKTPRAASTPGAIGDSQARATASSRLGRPLSVRNNGASTSRYDAGVASPSSACRPQAIMRKTSSARNSARRDSLPGSTTAPGAVLAVGNNIAAMARQALASMDTSAGASGAAAAVPVMFVPRRQPETARHRGKPAGNTAATVADGTAAAAASNMLSPRSAIDSQGTTVEDVRQQLRLLRMQHLQLRHINAKMEAALQAKKQKAEGTIAAAALATVDLSSQLAAVNSELQQKQWQSQLSRVLKSQLPLLQAWKQTLAQHSSNVQQLQAACNAALSHVPLLNGAVVGQHPEQPDLDQLQRQLLHGMQLLEDTQPAMQQLLGPDFGNSGSSNASYSAQIAAKSTPFKTAGQQQGLPETRNGVKATAALAEQLMGVAQSECQMLQHLAQQVSQLTDMQLYANSLQVQLMHMQQAEAAQQGDVQL